MVESTTTAQVGRPAADPRSVPEPRGPLLAARPTVRGCLRLLTFATAFVAAGFLGRLTIIDDRALSLVWPAAGIAALWIGSSRGWARIPDVVTLAASVLLVNVLTGATGVLGLVFVVTNVAQVLLFVALVRQWVPGLWGFGGTEELRRLRDLGLLAGAATTACLAGALIGMVGLTLTLGSSTVADFGVWWGRNAVAVIVMVTLGLLLGRPLATAGSWPALRATTREALRPASTLRAVEAAVLVIASVGLYVLLFVSAGAAPLVFLILIMSVWAGIRFAPLAVAVHGVAMGAAGIVYTLAGIGPFAAIESLHYRALVAQVFVAMAVLKGLALSFSRRERDDALVELGLARRATAERAALLDAVLESMKEGVLVMEDDGHVVVRNSAGRRLLGLGEAESDFVQSTETYGLFHPNGMPLAEDEVPGYRALAGEKVEAEDFHVRSPAVPQGRVVEISAHRLHQEPGSPNRAMVNVRDVTLDRQHRDTLASFAGVVAHDLFSPLSVVEGWSELLETELANGPLTPATGLPMVARIHDAAAHMSRSIHDLLSYTVARDQSLRSVATDLTVLVRELARLRAEAPTAPVIAVADGLHAWADEGLMRQLFDNLLGNAVKYVAAGTRPAVDVQGSVEGDRLVVRITDNGIGIPPEERQHVFDTFHRAHNGYPGTGLGLAICHRIVDRHGGTIHVEEGPNGIGSRFVLDLPTVPAPLVPRAEAVAGVR